MTAAGRWHETRHYATGDPATPDRAAFNVGVTLGTWEVPAPVVEVLVTWARDLVAEVIETYDGSRVIVTAVVDGDRATVHAVSTECRQDHPGDLFDPSTAAVLREVAARWGAASPHRCPCRP
ncbi:hypothetical protein [Streptomyces fulvoviolaceus]|uniref:hypothetical protein n=1 Tax=Streptomyces fulvoviolaceus TaxID=285535 RepID=UPI0004C7BEB1|nr:hypothetical protein [Streptomyces fulvoviolaceus]